MSKDIDDNKNAPRLRRDGTLTRLEPPNPIRKISCGCCNNGCTCLNHMDIPNGKRPQICEYHSKSGHIEFLRGGAA